VNISPNLQHLCRRDKDEVITFSGQKVKGQGHRQHFSDGGILIDGSLSKIVWFSWGNVREECDLLDLLTYMSPVTSGAA